MAELVFEIIEGDDHFHHLIGTCDGCGGEESDVAAPDYFTMSEEQADRIVDDLQAAHVCTGYDVNRLIMMNGFDAWAEALLDPDPPAG